MPNIVSEEVGAYLDSLQSPADDLVREMEAHASRDSIPIAGRSLATLQSIFAQAMGANRALEYGTAIGYSTLFLARAGAKVVTMEVDQDRILAAIDYLERDGIDVRVTSDPSSVSQEPGAVTIITEPALDVVPRLDGPFDLIFIDAIKQDYEAYLRDSLPLLETGGVVIADNLLRAGEVATIDGGGSDDACGSARHIHAFNRHFVQHDALSSIITPQGDGVGIAVKTGSMAAQE